MEKNPDDLSGLDINTAKEYILAHKTQIKLNEKQAAVMDAEADTWKKRAALALAKAEAGLAAQAEEQAALTEAKAAALREETAELNVLVERMIRQLPGLAARQRSIDPDMLQQELLVAAGFNPGEEEELARERAFAALEKETAANEALAALKTKMAGSG